MTSEAMATSPPSALAGEPAAAGPNPAGAEMLVDIRYAHS